MTRPAESARLILAALAVAAAAACAPPGSAAYREGYTFGCREGHDVYGEPEWFAERMQTPAHGGTDDYARGWRDGFAYCGNRVIARPTGGG